MKKYCLSCRQECEFDSIAKRNSKKSGFQGGNCWPCFLKNYKRYFIGYLDRKERGEGRLNAVKPKKVVAPKWEGGTLLYLHIEAVGHVEMRKRVNPYTGQTEVGLWLV